MSVVQQVAETLQRGNNCLLSVDGSCKTYVISQLMQSLGRKLVFMTGEMNRLMMPPVPCAVSWATMPSRSCPQKLYCPGVGGLFSR